MIPNNISKEHITKALKWIDRNGVPKERASTKFNLVFEEKNYPPKYVISIANIFANGNELSPTQFSGGEETNNYLSHYGFRIVGMESKFPIRAFSWIVLSSTVFIKEMDKSSFLHHGTGMPREIYHYFELDTLKKGERKNIYLFYKGVSYDARIEMDRMEPTRARLFWKTDFAGLIRTNLPEWYTYYQENTPSPGTHPPNLRLERGIKGRNEYWVDFINPTEITMDINAEIEEELESKAEGALKYFYGKKYERNPENRKRAIEIHGTICSICEFDFEKVYGERGRGYIEIHHTKPLSTMDGEQIIDPAKDLIPVCSNCHRMIHRRVEQVLSIEEMKNIIRTKDEINTP